MPGAMPFPERVTSWIPVLSVIRRIAARAPVVEGENFTARAALPWAGTVKLVVAEVKAKSPGLLPTSSTFKTVNVGL